MKTLTWSDQHKATKKPWTLTNCNNFGLLFTYLLNSATSDFVYLQTQHLSTGLYRCSWCYLFLHNSWLETSDVEVCFWEVIQWGQWWWRPWKQRPAAAIHHAYGSLCHQHVRLSFIWKPLIPRRIFSSLNDTLVIPGTNNQWKAWKWIHVLTADTCLLFGLISHHVHLIPHQMNIMTDDQRRQVSVLCIVCYCYNILLYWACIGCS